MATLAWNTHRHVELYYAVPGARLVLHTLNLRLHADQIAWIAAHADDRVIFVDDSLVPLVEPIAAKLPRVRAWVLMGDGPLPKTTLAPAWRYEDLVARGDPKFCSRRRRRERGGAALLHVGHDRAIRRACSTATARSRTPRS